MTNTLRGILSAMTYYDAFEFPLTAQEIFFALPKVEGPHPSFEETERALEEIVRRGVVGASEGYYFLSGREAIVATRKSRYALAERKYAKARSFIACARFAPFVRAVFVCNTLARANARAESDIDLFLVTSPGRIWLTRFFVTGLATLLRVRPTTSTSADRICLSFFVTTETLNVRPLAIDDDVYLAHWLQELCPVYDEAGIVRRSFIENGWLREVLPETRLQLPSVRRMIAPIFVPFKRFIERGLDAMFGDRLEHWARERQLRWMPAALRAAAGTPGSGVVLNDGVLKFHDHDRRAEIRDAYREKYAHVLGRLA